MAWTAGGLWTPEDDNTATSVAKVVDAGGPLMKQAAGLGLSTANKRGLANSSIAVGSSQAETLKAATPIGLQNVSALEANNQYKYGMDLQRLQDTNADGRLDKQIASTERLSANELNARMSELNTRIAADIKLAQQGDVAAMERLQLDLGSRATLQESQQKFDAGQTDKQISSTERLSAAEITARK